MRWHLCSLDAPTVAVVWAISLCRLAMVTPGAAELAVLGLGTWIVYVLDRVLDGAGGRCGFFEPDRLRARHHFHHRHRRLLLSLCTLAAAVLAVLCLRLPPRLVGFYLLLGMPVAAYGLRVHRRLLWPLRFHQTRARRGGGKEAAVAVLFAAAVAAPAFAPSPVSCRPALAIATCLLALLCWLNCALISHAEAADGLKHPNARQQLALYALALAGAAACVSLWERSRLAARAPSRLSVNVLAERTRDPATAVMLSCLLLFILLHSLRKQGANASRVRVLADLGLLTPLLLLLPRSQ